MSKESLPQACKGDNPPRCSGVYREPPGTLPPTRESPPHPPTLPPPVPPASSPPSGAPGDWWLGGVGGASMRGVGWGSRGGECLCVAAQHRAIVGGRKWQWKAATTADSQTSSAGRPAEPGPPLTLQRSSSQPPLRTHTAAAPARGDPQAAAGPAGRRLAAGFGRRGGGWPGGPAAGGGGGLGAALASRLLLCVCLCVCMCMWLVRACVVLPVSVAGAREVCVFA